MPSPKRPAGPASSPVSARLAIFVLGSLLVSGLIQSQIEDFELIEISPYFCFVIAIQFLPFMVRARADLFEPACVAAAFNLIAFVPAFTSFLAQRSVTISMLPLVTGRARIELAQTVLVGCSIATLSYYAGYYVGWGKHATRLFPDIAGAEWRRSRLLLVTGICAAAFLPAYAYFQSRVGASITDITQLAAGKAVWREDTTMSWLHRGIGLGFVPVLLFVARYFKGLDVPRWIPGPPILAHAVHVVRHVPIFFRSLRGRRALLTLFAFLVIGFLATRLGQRSVALWVALSGLIIAHYLWRRLPTTMIVALAFVAMVFVNVLGAYRSNQEPMTASAPGPTANFNAAETLVEHEDDRQRFAAMAVVFHYFPDRVDYLMGESWAAVGAVLIPRWLWPDKAKMFRWRDTNMVPELVGRPVPVSYQTLLYANFSWIGLVLGMALFGLYQRALYEWLLRSPKDKGVVVFYSLAVLYLVPTLIQLSAAISYLLPVYVALVFIGKKVKAVKVGARGKPPVLARPALPAAEPGPTAAE